MLTSTFRVFSLFSIFLLFYTVCKVDHSLQAGFIYSLASELYPFQHEVAKKSVLNFVNTLSAQEHHFFRNDLTRLDHNTLHYTSNIKLGTLFTQRGRVDDNKNSCLFSPDLTTMWHDNVRLFFCLLVDVLTEHGEIPVHCWQNGILIFFMWCIVQCTYMLCLYNLQQYVPLIFITVGAC